MFSNMHRWDDRLGEYVQRSNTKNPSFSSTLLDKIYRSTEESDVRREELKSYRETVTKQQSKGTEIRDRAMEENTTALSLRRRFLLDTWMEKKADEKFATGRRTYTGNSKSNHHRLDHDHDYSSPYCFSDSSSRRCSSSDREPVHRMKSPSLCFAPLRPKPLRTSLSSVSERLGKVKRRHSALFCEQRELHSFCDDRHRCLSDHISKHSECFSRSKSEALKMSSNHKNAKQPISPGARITNFLTSLFTAGSRKKIKTASQDANTERKKNSRKASTSTCSSASSYSRTCLIKHSPATIQNLRNRARRSVQFYPVSVIVDGDCRPCGHKCLHRKDDNSNLLSVPAPTASNIGWAPTWKNEEDPKLHVMENRRSVEQAAMKFLKEYRQNQKNDLNFRNSLVNSKAEDEDDDDEDAASCSSSDLFELDHLKIMGNHRYSDELPVYETTHMGTNHAIAKGVMV